MHHEGNCAGQEPEDKRHGDGTDHNHDQLGVGGTTGSGMAVPPTVLVTEVDNGALIVQGRPDGPRMHLTPGQAVALRGELATAFGCAGRGLGDSQGELG